MRIELLVVPDCPHEAAAAELLTSAMEDVGLGNHAHTDPNRDASIACRVYPGSGGLPELREIRQALKRAAADHR